VGRIVGECAAPLVFLENVARHLSAGFDVVARDLQGMGYQVAALVCRAATVGAPHQRERLFALAVSDAGRERIGQLAEWMQGEAAEREHAELAHMGEGVADTNGSRLQPEWRTPDQLTGQAQRDDVDGCNMPPWPPGPDDLGRWATVPVECWPSVESSVRSNCKVLRELGEQ
jgi:DNA (cytosine-5)-methyltransferase 1